MPFIKQLIKCSRTHSIKVQFFLVYLRLKDLETLVTPGHGVYTPWPGLKTSVWLLGLKTQPPLSSLSPLGENRDVRASRLLTAPFELAARASNLVPARRPSSSPPLARGTSFPSTRGTSGLRLLLAARVSPLPDGLYSRHEYRRSPTAFARGTSIAALRTSRHECSASLEERVPCARGTSFEFPPLAARAFHVPSIIVYDGQVIQIGSQTEPDQSKKCHGQRTTSSGD